MIDGLVPLGGFGLVGLNASVSSAGSGAWGCGVLRRGVLVLAVLACAGCVAPGVGARKASASSSRSYPSAATGPTSSSSSGGAVGGADFMRTWETVTTPGRAHEFFGLLQGSWNAEVTVVMAPGAEAGHSRGLMVNSIIHGGRYLLSEYEGQPAEPFGALIGRGWLGFDNAGERYQGVWIDNMSTTMRPVAQGTLDADGRVLTMHSTYHDPFERRERTQREVTTIHGRSRHTFEVFNDDGQGGEFRSMFIVYSRINVVDGR